MHIEVLPWLAIFTLAFYSAIARYSESKYSISGWESFKLFALIVLALCVIAAIVGAVVREIHKRIDAARLKKERKAFLARQAMVEDQHPGTRATLLSSGLWLLTDVVTGKAVGEVDDSSSAPAAAKDHWVDGLFANLPPTEASAAEAAGRLARVRRWAETVLREADAQAHMISIPKGELENVITSTALSPRAIAYLPCEDLVSDAPSLESAEESLPEFELSAEEIAEFEAEARRHYRITHYYDIGNQDVYVEHPTGEVDGRRVALYCWFKASEWFGDAAMVSNLGIASLMVAFYGFEHCAKSLSTTVDLYADTERCAGEEYKALMQDGALYREGLREAMAPHVTLG